MEQQIKYYLEYEKHQVLQANVTKGTKRMLTKSLFHFNVEINNFSLT